MLRLVLLLFLILPSTVHGEREYSSGYTLNVELAKEIIEPGEALEGEVVITATRTGYPVTFEVRMYRDEELRYTKLVQFPQLYMGRENYPLETFGIKEFREPGLWRIEIGPPGSPQTEIKFEVLDPDAPSEEPPSAEPDPS